MGALQRRAIPWIATLCVTACGGGSVATAPAGPVPGPAVTASPAGPGPTPTPRSTPAVTAPLPLSNALGSFAAGSGDDWTTFAHDARRTGIQAQPVGFDRTSVRALATAWHYRAPATIKASPLVAGGTVFIATQAGDVVALDATTGGVQWSVNLGGEIAMTPTLADGMLFVATHAPPATMAALDATTGAIRWRRTFDYALRSEPVVINGTVVMGLAGGDPPACRNGGVTAFDEFSGATRWTWLVSQTPSDGGSVWGPISTDGTRLYFGTGNTCWSNPPTGNAIIALGLDGSASVWDLATVDARSDDDIGGGVLILGNLLTATSKDATLRVVDANRGVLIGSLPLPAADGYGGIGTPTTDGSTLFVSAGSSADPASGPQSHGTLLGYDATLHERWRIVSRAPVRGYVAIGGGVAFVTLDDQLVGLDPATGIALWSAALGSPAYASPVVVPSGVYAASNAGDVYAFRSATTSASAHRRER